MIKRIALIIPLFIFMALLLVACGEDATPTFKAQSTKEDVDIRSTYKDDVVTFQIYTASGIGDAAIELTAGKMPGTVQVRLFVDKLENLELTYGDVRIGDRIRGWCRY